MDEITVTMPLKEYEKLKSDLAKAESESVRNYITKEYFDIMRNQSVKKIDFQRIKEDFNAIGPTD